MGGTRLRPRLRETSQQQSMWGGQQQLRQLYCNYQASAGVATAGGANAGTTQ
jgi:hypothetical protein